MEELKMTSYLEGLKKLFDKYGVMVAYSRKPFTNTKDDGVIIYVKGITPNQHLEFLDYMDNYVPNDDGIIPELRSFAVAHNLDNLSGLHVIYLNGKFYE